MVSLTVSKQEEIEKEIRILDILTQKKSKCTRTVAALGTQMSLLQ